jgi:hypothetical protein
MDPSAEFSTGTTPEIASPRRTASKTPWMVAASR